MSQSSRKPSITYCNSLQMIPNIYNLKKISMKFLESFTVRKTNTLGYLPVPWEHSLSVLIHMVTGWTKNLPYHFLFLSPVVFFRLLLCILQVPIFLSSLSSSPPCCLSKFLVYFLHSTYYNITSSLFAVYLSIFCLYSLYSWVFVDRIYHQ